MSPTLCRLCLHVSEALIDIFEKSWKSKHLQMKISSLFSFLIEQNDFLRFICIQCTNCVMDFYNFCQKVKETQIYLSQKDLSKYEIYQAKRDNDSQIDEHQVDREYFFENTPLIENKGIQLVKDEQELEKSDIKNPNQVNALSVCTLPGPEYQPEFIDDKEYVELKIENGEDGQSINGGIPNELDSDDNLQSYKEFNENARLLSRSKMFKSKKKLRDCKLSKKVKKQSRFSNESPFLFPVELIRDGKLIMKGAPLDQLIYEFYNIQCDICTNLPKFKRISKLMKHFAGFHNMPGYLTCCNSRLYNHRSIYLHMARHLQPSAFECPICKKAVTRPHTLKLHMQTHLPEAEKLHKCDECDQSFSYVGGLKRHKKSHHVPMEERKVFNCNTCGKGYTFRSTLTTHMKTHQSSSKFLCAECGRTLQSKSELRCHMLTHDQTGINKVQCKHCGFICKNLLCLRIHEKRHTGIKFTCKECPYTTHRKQQLKEHTRLKHTDDKPYICVVCGKSFKLKSVLNNHMARHTGEAKFNCPFCSRTFASSSNCYSHRKRMHADEYKNELNKKFNERFKKVEMPEIDTKEEMKIENIHKLAREYLRKVSLTTVSDSVSGIRTT